jgi:hypothetical protein
MVAQLVWLSGKLLLALTSTVILGSGSRETLLTIFYYLTIAQLVKKRSAFYKARRFIHGSELEPNFYIIFRFILILSFHLRLDIPSGIFPSDFTTIVS